MTRIITKIEEKGIFTLKIYCSIFARFPTLPLFSYHQSILILSDFFQQNQGNIHVSTSKNYSLETWGFGAHLSQKVCAYGQAEIYGQLGRIFLLQQHLPFFPHTEQRSFWKKSLNKEVQDKAQTQTVFIELTCLSFC